MRRTALLACGALTGALMLAGPARAGEYKKATVLNADKAITVERAYIDQGSLWVPQGELAAINGFELKPQGLCRGPLCIPVPQGAGWSRQVDGKPYFNLSAFSKKIGQAAKADSSESVWSFSLPTKLNGGLASGMAPDFALPTVDGKIVRLSDFRGKKVLILTWASW